MSKQEKFVNESDDDTDEGAKILKILEASAEPEVLMADMSPQELTSISNYQAKQEVIFFWIVMLKEVITPRIASTDGVVHHVEGFVSC